MDRKGHVIWKGDIKTGTGVLSVGSGALKETKYGFRTRFENETGTNPEELIAAAHAGCFSMALSGILGEAGFKPETIETTATVSVEKSDMGFTITRSHLETTVKAAGLDEKNLKELTQKAKEGCPVSRALKLEMSVDARLG